MVKDDMNSHHVTTKVHCRVGRETIIDGEAESYISWLCCLFNISNISLFQNISTILYRVLRYQIWY